MALDRLPKAICTTPRTGSTALGEFLAQNYNVDEYLEFFNTKYMFKRVGSWKKARNEQYKCLQDPRIGLKIMWEHVNVIETWPYLKEHGAIFLTRVDKVAQAVSYYFATHTGRWYQTDERYKEPPAYDYDLITWHMHRIIAHETSWLEFFAKHEIDYEVKAYEDIVRELPLGERDEIYQLLKNSYAKQYKAELGNHNHKQWKDYWMERLK